MTTHWAVPLIGRPWSPDGEGPDSFSCWGLVRHVFREQLGIEMPAIRAGDFSNGENVAALKRATESSGFRQVTGLPHQMDVALMRGPDGARHVGVMVSISRGLVLLHSAGHMTIRTQRGKDYGPIATGSVVAQPLREVMDEGYTDLELWRRPK